MRKLILENEERHLDDVVDDMIRGAAPEIVRAIKEQEVDEDVNEFYEGAIDAVDDLESYMDYRFPHEEKYEDTPTNSELYDAGYAYGEANFDRIRDGLQGIVDAKTRRDQIVQAIEVFEERITEEAVIAALEEAYAYGKEQMGDIHGLIKLMQKKYGWKGYAAFVAIEVFEHAILPAALSMINPAFGIIAVIPTVEILAAVGLAYYKKYVKEPEPEQPHVPGHLDWYEEQQNLQAGYRRNTMRLTETQLRRLVRRKILTEMFLSENDGEYEYVMSVANSMYLDGTRRFNDFWKRVWPDLRKNGYERRDAEKTCRHIWKFIKDDYRPRDKYDNWSAWD